MLILVILIFALSAYIGLKRGLVRTVFSLFSTVVVILVGTVISPLISNALINNDKVFNKVAGNIEIAIRNYRENTSSGKTDRYENFLKKFGSKKRSNKISTSQGKSNDKINKLLSKNLAKIVINSATFIVIYIGLRLILVFIGSTLNIVSRLPILNELNRLGGAAVGLAKGLLIIWLIFTVMLIFINQPLVQEGLQQINKSKFLTLLFKYNILKNVIGL